MIRYLLAAASMGAGFWLAIAVVPPTGPWATLAIFAGTTACAYIARPRPVKYRNSAFTALTRLMIITTKDRIRCRDGRLNWWGDA